MEGEGKSGRGDGEGAFEYLRGRKRCQKQDDTVKITAEPALWIVKLCLRANAGQLLKTRTLELSREF